MATSPSHDYEILTCIVGLQQMYHHQNGQPVMVPQIPPAASVEGNNRNTNKNSTIDIPNPFGTPLVPAQAYPDNQALNATMMSSTSIPPYVSSIIGNNSNQFAMHPDPAIPQPANSAHNQHQGFSVDRQLKLLMEMSKLCGNTNENQPQHRGVASSQGFDGFTAEGVVMKEQSSHFEQQTSNAMSIDLQNVRSLTAEDHHARQAYHNRHHRHHQQQQQHQHHNNNHHHHHQQQQQMRTSDQVPRQYSRTFDMGQQQQRHHAYDPISQSFDLQQPDCHTTYASDRVQEVQQDAIPERCELTNLVQQDDDVSSRSMQAALFPSVNNVGYSDNKWQGMIKPPADKIGSYCWTQDPFPGGMVAPSFAAQHQGYIGMSSKMYQGQQQH